MELTIQARPDGEAEADIHYMPKNRPVDLAHLSRYTMGNMAVEREVLELFRRQTRLYFEKLSNAADEDSRREAARVLKASARSVGAWQILQTAETLEQASPDPSGPMREEMLRALSDQIREAHDFIDSLL